MLPQLATLALASYQPARPLAAASAASRPRTRSLLAQASSSHLAEEQAKAAWLARLEEPSWPRMGPSSSSARSTPPLTETAADASTQGWLLPGPPVLSLEAADEMSRVALHEASARGFNPVSVCVLDAAGRVLVTKTMLGCGNLTPDLAIAKASACVGLHCSSRELRDKYVNDDGIGPKMPQLLAFGMVAAASHQALGPFPGGVLCRDDAHNVIGAIGVSGAASDEDEHCAILAAKAVGLKPEPDASRLV